MKNPFIRNKISLQERIIKKTTKITNKLVEKKLKNKTFDQKAAIARRFIPMVGVPEMRRRIIESIELEVKECIEKGMTDEEILQPCKNSPNYRLLLNELDLNLDHIRAIIKDARGKQ